MSKNQITDVEAKEDKAKTIQDNPQSAIYAGLLTLGIGFIGFLIWGFIAQLDEGAHSQGYVIVDTKKKSIQHHTGGIVDAILVKDGQHVKKDQILVRLLDVNAKSQLAINQNQLVVLERQVKSIKPLVAEGYYPLNQFLDLEKQYKEAVVKVKVAKEEADRTELKSPVDGVVMGVAVNSVGAVLQQGAKVLEIIPAAEKLVIEAIIQPNLIDRMTAGLDAEIRFPAMNQRKTPILTGKVETVSADRFVDTTNVGDMGYYKARILVDAESIERMKSYADFSMQAGMPADVIIKTGKRSFFDYLIKPLLDRAAGAFKER